MSTASILYILVPFLVLLILGMPIAFVLGVTSAIYIIAKGIPLSIIPHRMCFSLDSFTLLAIPLFILTGKLMNTGGVTKRIFKFAEALVGHIKGGLGHVNVLASLIFAGMSGTALADIGGLGEVEIQAMKDAGYDLEFSTGVTLASSIIGPIIPPSVPLVIYGVLAEVPVPQLFLGGFLPGIVIAIALMLYIYFTARNRNYPVSERADFKKVVSSFVEAIPPLLTPFIIIGGMTLGIFSPTECAGVAALYALFLGTIVYKELKFADLLIVCKETIKATAQLMFLIASALLFSWVLSVELIPQLMAQALASVTGSPTVFLFIVVLILLFLGTFLENNAIMLLMIPIVVPAASALGVNLVHLGIVMMYTITLGLLTPPVGLGLFVVQDMTGLTLGQTVKAVAPFLIPLFISLCVLVLFPEIVLLLPNLFF